MSLKTNEQVSNVITSVVNAIGNKMAKVTIEVELFE